MACLGRTTRKEKINNNDVCEEIELLNGHLGSICVLNMPMTKKLIKECPCSLLIFSIVGTLSN